MGTSSPKGRWMRFGLWACGGTSDVSAASPWRRFVNGPALMLFPGGATGWTSRSRIAEPIVRQLLAADPSLRELEVTRAGLAEAFVQITKGSMQRGATHASQGLTPKAQPRTYTERAVLTQGETV